MESISHSEAIEQVFSGRVNRERGYCEIPTSLFVERMDVQMNAIPEIALYIRKETKSEAVFETFKEAKDPCSFLALSTHPSVWILDRDLSEVQTFSEKLLRKASTDPTVSPAKRVELLQRSAMKIVDNLFETPSKENIDRSVKVVGSFVYLLMKDPKSYMVLTNLSNHDPYTLRHSVGTSIHSVILGKKIGITNEQELVELGTAGLLHDIGKVKVKREIINKPGPLDELEWEEMKQHPQAGYDIVKDNPSLSDRVKRAILEHHEDRNGNGYPLKVKLDKTGLFSRIVCICDIFNALTTDRTYSKAKTPFEAFQLMKEKLSFKYDESLFQELVKIYGGGAV